MQITQCTTARSLRPSARMGVHACGLAPARSGAQACRCEGTCGSALARGDAWARGGTNTSVCACLHTHARARTHAHTCSRAHMLSRECARAHTHTYLLTLVCACSAHFARYICYHTVSSALHACACKCMHKAPSGVSARRPPPNGHCEAAAAAPVKGQ